MDTLFNEATRTAELLQNRSPSGQLEMLDSALDEGYAIVTSEGYGRSDYELEWHGIHAQGAHELEAIANWITLALRESEEAV